MTPPSRKHRVALILPHIARDLSCETACESTADKHLLCDLARLAAQQRAEAPLQRRHPPARAPHILAGLQFYNPELA